MPADERRRRMNKMRAAVSSNNVYRWAGKIIQTLSGVKVCEPERRSEPEDVFEMAGAK